MGFINLIAVVNGLYKPTITNLELGAPREFCSLACRPLKSRKSTTAAVPETCYTAGWPPAAWKHRFGEIIRINQL